MSAMPSDGAVNTASLYLFTLGLAGIVYVATAVLLAVWRSGTRAAARRLRASRRRARARALEPAARAAAMAARERQDGMRTRPRTAPSGQFGARRYGPAPGAHQADAAPDADPEPDDEELLAAGAGGVR